jgi:hypothetical protein
MPKLNALLATAVKQQSKTYDFEIISYFVKFACVDLQCFISFRHRTNEGE